MTEGERWAREALAELRAARAPVAFLKASFRRAAETRRQRRALARQARAWAMVGAVAWMVPPARPHARVGLPWWVAMTLMLDWHLGMVESEEGQPRMLGGADACTLLRAWLVPLAARDPRPLVLALGLATDAADGALARRSVPTRAGRDLEGIVDNAFGLAAARGLVSHGRLGRAAAALEVARLTGGFVYAAASYGWLGRPPDAAHVRAGRPTAPLRAAGFVAAAGGHRRLGDALLGAGAGAGVAAGVLSAAGRGSRRRGSRPGRC